MHQSQLRSWVKMFADYPQHAFPGQEQMKPEQLEIARLKREVTKLKAERDILKKGTDATRIPYRMHSDYGSYYWIMISPKAAFQSKAR